MNNKTDQTSKNASDNPGIHGESWLDKQDILTRLHISSRTLQRWRSEGIIPFTKVRGKIYYKESDLKILLGKSIIKSK